MNSTALQGTQLGTNDVPPLATAASGTGAMVYCDDTDTFDFALSRQGMALGSVTAFHIHLGAAGVKGPIVVTLNGPSMQFVDLGKGTIQGPVRIPLEERLDVHEEGPIRKLARRLDRKLGDVILPQLIEVRGSRAAISPGGEAPHGLATHFQVLVEEASDQPLSNLLTINAAEIARAERRPVAHRETRSSRRVVSVSRARSGRRGGSSDGTPDLPVAWGT